MYSLISQIDIAIYGKSLRELGTGSYGVVKLHKNSLTGEQVAIKKIHNDEYGGIESDAMIEVSALITLQGHPNIVKMLGCSFGQKKTCIVLEAATTSLETYICKTNTIPLDFVRSVTCQILRGLRWIHDKEFWHQDLKPANILLYEDGRVVIADFGLAKSGPLLCSDKNSVFTLWYRAPEVLFQDIYGRQSRYRSSSDVWAIGAILLAMLLEQENRNYLHGYTENGQLRESFKMMTEKKDDTFILSFGITKDELLNKFPDITPDFLANNRPKLRSILIDGVEDDLFNLLCSLLEFNPLNRISVDAAINHPALTGIKALLDKELLYLLKEENYGDSSCNIIDENLTQRIWSILTDWLYDVAQKMRLSASSYSLCIHVLKCFLSDPSKRNKQKLQGYGIAALALANSYQGSGRMDAGDASYLTDGSSSKETIVQNQKEIFTAIGGQLHLHTTWTELISIIEANMTPKQIEEISLADIKKLERILMIILCSPLSFTISNRDIAQMAFDKYQKSQKISIEENIVREWLQTEDSQKLSLAKFAQYFSD